MKCPKSAQRRLPRNSAASAKPSTSAQPVGGVRVGANPLAKLDLESGELAMMTIRTHDQFNTTVYGMHDRYRGIHNERRVILMHADDIRERGLKAGVVVDLTGHFEGEVRHAPRFVVVEYDVPRGCCATYFPETNVLVPLDSTAERSGTPTSKYVRITVARTEII